MDKAHPLSTLMVVQFLYIKKDPHRPIEENGGVLGHEVPYLSVVGAPMYLALCTGPDISFSIKIYLPDIASHQLDGNGLVLNTS